MKRLFLLFGFLLLTPLMTHAGSMVSAYNQASYSQMSTIKSKLKKSGFQLLGSYHPAGKKHLDVLLFTNKELKQAASKEQRGFAAVQRVLVDTQSKSVLVTNPAYWLQAFLQDEYSASVSKSVADKITKALGSLKATGDQLDSSDLSGYRFMFAMPYYEDMITLKKRAKGVKSTSKLFSLKLANGSEVVGVKLDAEVEEFVDTIGTDKALVLPYLVVIEKGTAYTLHPKYYLAISYPKLSMGQFMEIVNTPGKIEDALKRAVE